MLVLAAAAAVQAGEIDQRELKGRALFFQGEYQQALDIYSTLFAETNETLYLRNIGRCHQKLGHANKAIEAFQEYLRRSPRLKESERQEINGFIDEMEALKRAESDRADAGAAAVVPPPAPPDGGAQIDPPPVLPLPPVPPPPIVIERTDTRAGSSSITHKWWFWTGIGAVVAGAVVGIVLLGRGPSSPDCRMGYRCP